MPAMTIAGLVLRTERTMAAMSASSRSTSARPASIRLMISGSASPGVSRSNTSMVNAGSTTSARKRRVVAMWRSPMHKIVNRDALSRASSSWRSPRLARRFSTSARRRPAGIAANASIAFVANSSYPACCTNASAGISIGIGEGTKLSRAHWAVLHTKPSSINTDATISVVRTKLAPTRDSTNDQAADLGQIRDLSRHAAHEHTLDLTEAPRAEDDEIGLTPLRVAQDDGRRVAVLQG